MSTLTPAHLTLKQLSYFVVLAEERHFRRAAARLHVTQPPLTQRIQALERDLGVALFMRDGHRVELTEAGRLVLAEAQATLAQADRVCEVARQAGRGEAGDLRVSVVISGSFVRTFSEATEAFQRDYPGVALDLVQTTCRGAIDALQQRKSDICVLRRAGPPLTGIEQMVIARDRLMLVLPANHPKALAEKVALSDVADERFIQFSSEKSVALFKQIEGLWTRTGLVPRVTQKAESGLAILALVAAGFGNAVLPSTLKGSDTPNVVWKPIDVDDQWTSSSILMLYRTEARNEKVQSRFIDYVRRFSAESN